MSMSHYVLRFVAATGALLLALNTIAQQPSTEKPKEEKPSAESAAAKNTETTKTATTAQPAKKMVQDATINLQTTVTGNQEQPRVLYILPWQSPATTSVDFESFNNQQQAVFGHVEREELRRELESSGETQ